MEGCKGLRTLIIMKKNIQPVQEEDVYDAFPPHIPNRPFFELNQRHYFGTEDELKIIENILNAPRENINWHAYSRVNGETSSLISFFSENFYKDIFPSLLYFSISPKSILPSGGINDLVGNFVGFHLETDNVYKDWELDFLLSFNLRQSRIVALILSHLNEKWALEKYWASYLP